MITKERNKNSLYSLNINHCMIKRHFLNTLYASNTVEEDTREKCFKPSFYCAYIQETMKEVENEHIIKK